MSNFLKEIISEKSGKASSTRIIALLWGCGILLCIIFLTIKDEKLPNVPSEILYSLLGVLGIKSFQRGKEK